MIPMAWAQNPTQKTLFALALGFVLQSCRAARAAMFVGSQIKPSVSTAARRYTSTNTLNLINLLINRARTRAALGTPFSKRTPPPSRRRAAAEPLTSRRGPSWPPEPPQGEHPSTFWRPEGASKIDRFSDPSKSTKVGDKVAHWPPHGRQWLHVGCFWVSFWDPFPIKF